MAEVAKLLGVRLYDEFHVEGYGTDVFRFTEEGLFFHNVDNEKWQSCYGEIMGILLGKEKITDIVWMPNYGDEYFTYCREGFNVCRYNWYYDADDFLRMKCGAVFRTAEEAEREKPRIYKELTGKEYAE